MTRLAALLVAASWAIVVACGGASKSAVAPTASGGAAPTQASSPMPGDPRAEIDALDAQLTGQLAELGLPTSEPAACAAQASCSAEPLSYTPYAEDPACRPAHNDRCTQACTLGDSICKTADRICTLAKQLGGTDAYANEKCQRGNTSCEKSHERCCGCT